MLQSLPSATGTLPRAKIQISVMSARGWNSMFGHCYTLLVQHITKNGVKGYNLEELLIDTTSGQSLIHDGRHQACIMAMERGCTHLLMIDDDMQFTPDLLDVFMSRKVPIVGANCLRKRDTKKEATAIRLDSSFHEPGTRTDIEEVQSLGTGIILINLDAIRHIPAPYFSSPWVPSLKQHMGEDYYFSMKAREHGVKVYVDNLVSNASAHMGDFAYHWGNNHPLSSRSFHDLSFLVRGSDKPELEKIKSLIK